MIKAYILLTLELGNTEHIIEEIKKIDNIESISVVTGPFDLILKVKVDNLDQLYNLTYITLSKISGIVEITTHVVEKELISDEG
ncbi:MAG: Lrp/AsnC family transcriptional regulator [Candidatus Odinarchaeia archaeon]